MGAAASDENYERVNFAKLIKHWEKHGLGADLREEPCGTVDLIFPENEVDLINNVKGNFKRKTLAVGIAAILILKKIKDPTAATKAIFDTFNITVTPQAIGQMKKSIVNTHKQAHEENVSNMSNL